MPPKRKYLSGYAKRLKKKKEVKLVKSLPRIDTFMLRKPKDPGEPLVNEQSEEHMEDIVEEHIDGNEAVDDLGHDATESDAQNNDNPRMTTSIVDHSLPSDTHNLYDVSFYNDEILTLVTHSAPMVESWLSEIIPIVNLNPIVGLDAEWRPGDQYDRNSNHPIATLQLCVHRRCLIFQLIHAQTIPRALSDFLANGSYTFVGAGIKNDVEKLLYYDLKVTNALDLGPLAATKLGKIELKTAGLKGLSKEVLGKEIQKHGTVAWSRWDDKRLTHDQVQYACIDAFISSEIGRRLTAMA